MAVTRTSFSTVRQDDIDYYRREIERGYAIAFPYTCHGCGTEQVAGDQICTLRHTTNDSIIWGECCASQFEREPGY